MNMIIMIFYNSVLTLFYKIAISGCIYSGINTILLGTLILHEENFDFFYASPENCYQCETYVVGRPMSLGDLNHWET